MDHVKKVADAAVENTQALYQKAADALTPASKAPAPATSEAGEKDFLPQLWYFPLSYATHKARLALEEKQIPYRQHNINILTGENLDPAFLKLNPKGTVPALQIEGQVLTSSDDVLLYADSIGGPSNEAHKEKLQYWIKREGEFDANLYTEANNPKAIISTMFDVKIKIAQKNAVEHPELAEIYNAKIAALQKETVDYVDNQKVTAAHEKLVSILQEVEEQLKQTPYIAGDEFTLSDVIIMTLLARVESLNKQKELIAPRTALAKYWEALKQRPSYKKVIGAYLGLGGLSTLLPTFATLAIKNTFKWY